MLVENDVSRCENATRLWIISAVSLGVVRVAKEDAGQRSGSQFVGGGGGGVWEAAAAKDAQMIVVQLVAKQE